MIDVNEYLKGFYKGTKEPSLKAMHYFMDKYNNFEKEMKFIQMEKVVVQKFYLIY